MKIEVNGLELGSHMPVDGCQLLCKGPAPALDLVSHAVAADVAFCLPPAGPTQYEESLKAEGHLSVRISLPLCRLCAIGFAQVLVSRETQ